MHAGKQQPAEKDCTAVGIGAELRQHPRFGLHGDPPQRLRRKSGFQTRGEIRKIAPEHVDGMRHQRIIQIGVGAVVPSVDQARFGREVKFQTQPANELFSQPPHR